MLRSLRSMLGFQVEATDGHCGKVRDFHFDSGTGCLRYIVVSLGFRYPWHNVLIPAEKIGKPDWDASTLSVNQTRYEIGHAPLISADPPIYLQIQEQARDYCTWATHWTPFSGMPEPEPAFHRRPGSNRQSLEHLLGYEVDTMDGQASYLTDLFVDDVTWQVRSIATNASPGKQILILVDCIRSISCEHQTIYLEIDRAGLIGAPVYDQLAADDATLEERLKAHYARVLQHV
jgi:hypothetical protein